MTQKADVLTGNAVKAEYLKAQVWRKQAVDFAENIANEQGVMMPSFLRAGDIT